MLFISLPPLILGYVFVNLPFSKQTRCGGTVYKFVSRSVGRDVCFESVTFLTTTFSIEHKLCIWNVCRSILCVFERMLVCFMRICIYFMHNQQHRSRLLPRPAQEGKHHIVSTFVHFAFTAYMGLGAICYGALDSHRHSA